MSTRESGDLFDNEKYQRPNQPWMCGWHSDGTPCPLGPNHQGTCQIELTCTPQKDGDKWVCTSHKLFGLTKRECTGPIPDRDNPSAKATCPNSPPPCQPVRSDRKKRTLLTGLAIAASLGCCLLLTGSPATHSAISPGAVTSHHASIEQNCAACHAAAERSAVSQVSCVFGGSDGLDQSMRCLKCHDLGENALYPHSMDPNVVGAMSSHIDSDALAETMATANQRRSGEHTLWQELARMSPELPTTEKGELACATCHQEHKGRMHSLSRITNEQCQSCHSSTFHSFGDGHPEFVDNRRTHIYFDHWTHIGTHFANYKRTMPDGVAPTSCTACHTASGDGHPMALRSFEDACGSCHGPQIHDVRMPAIQLFGMESNARLAPFAELLFSDDGELNQALNSRQNTAATGNAIDSGDESEADQVASKYELAMKSLIGELKSDGQSSLAMRLPAADSATIRRLVDAGLADELSQLDGLSNSAEEDSDSPMESPALFSPGFHASGAMLDYRATGHADKVMRTLLDIAAAHVTDYSGDVGSDASPAERMLKQLGHRDASGHCLKCHTLDARGETVRINWTPRKPKTMPGEFVNLLDSHPSLSEIDQSPHDQKILLDAKCESCHAVQQDRLDFYRQEFVLSDGMPNTNRDCGLTAGLNRMTTTSCVKCHTPEVAGDNCVQCHNYHNHGTRLIR